MFERAVLRMPTGNVYDADVDLWSLGIMLFSDKNLDYDCFLDFYQKLKMKADQNSLSLLCQL